MRFSDRTYDILKWIQKILVLLATFYTTIANIWGFPYGEQIVGTITAIVTFFGVILGISTKNYYKEAQDESEDIFTE